MSSEEKNWRPIRNIPPHFTVSIYLESDVKFRTIENTVGFLRKNTNHSTREECQDTLNLLCKSTVVSLEYKFIENGSEVNYFNRKLRKIFSDKTTKTYY